jgi:hypothetical protein
MSGDEAKLDRNAFSPLKLMIGRIMFVPSLFLKDKLPLAHSEGVA